MNLLVLAARCGDRIGMPRATIRGGFEKSVLKLLRVSKPFAFYWAAFPFYCKAILQPSLSFPKTRWLCALEFSSPTESSQRCVKTTTFHVNLGRAILRMRLGITDLLRAAAAVSKLCVASYWVVPEEGVEPTRY